jgi:hypothetical protein
MVHRCPPHILLVLLGRVAATSLTISTSTNASDSATGRRLLRLLGMLLGRLVNSLSCLLSSWQSRFPSPFSWPGQGRRGGVERVTSASFSVISHERGERRGGKGGRVPLNWKRICFRRHPAVARSRAREAQAQLVTIDSSSGHRKGRLQPQQYRILNYILVETTHVERTQSSFGIVWTQRRQSTNNRALDDNKRTSNKKESTTVDKQSAFMISYKYTIPAVYMVYKRADDTYEKPPLILHRAQVQFSSSRYGTRRLKAIESDFESEPKRRRMQSNMKVSMKIISFDCIIRTRNPNRYNRPGK